MLKSVHYTWVVSVFSLISVCAPLCLQALPQAQNPQRPSEWWHLRHAEKLVEAQADDYDVVLIGDSITQYAERDSLYGYYFGNRKVLNLGFGGDGTEHVLWRLRNGELDGVQPKLVSLMIGTNNARNHSAEAIVAGIEAILDELEVRVPEAQVILFSVFPRKAGKEQTALKAVNAELPRFAARKQVKHININEQFYRESGELNADLYHTDLLHLSSGGYGIWWAGLEPFVSAALGEISLSANPHRAIQSAPRGGPRHEQKLLEVQEEECQLVFVGDSITHFWERDGEFGLPVWERYYEHREALNLGFGGDRTEWVNWRLQNGEVDGIDPKVVVLMIGTNNTHVTKDAPEETLAGIASNLRTIRYHMPNAKVLLLSIFPRGEGAEDPLRQINEQINEQLPELAARDAAVYHLNINEHFLDAQGRLPRAIMPDLLHPNTKGYEIWAAAMEPTLSQLLNDQPVE
jgi:lysophospholipase L1-like esterase